MNRLKPATKLAAICIGIIALAAIICFCLSQYLRADQPAIYKVYGAYPFYGQEEYVSLDEELFQIPYLLPRSGSINGIQDLEFKGFEDELEASTRFLNQDEGVGFYFLERLSPSFAEGGDYQWPDSPITLTSATVRYDVGKPKTVDVGKIILYPKPLEGEMPLEMDETGDDEGDFGKGRKTMTMKAGAKLKLRSAACIPTEAKGKLTINGLDFDQIKGKEIVKGEKLEFRVTAPQEAGVLNEPAVNLVYETADGKEHTQILGSFTQERDRTPGFLKAIGCFKERGLLK